uniref:Uncharacterized protein n=1 Tax=Daphnia magna TaxID=35525 RepID=A0A0P6JBU8_9CRUS
MVLPIIIILTSCNSGRRGNNEKAKTFDSLFKLCFYVFHFLNISIRFLLTSRMPDLISKFKCNYL